MKIKLFRVAIALCIILAWKGCSKDLGNYTYQELDQITVVDGLESVYEALTGLPFYLDPQFKIEGKNSFVEQDYDYEWFSIDEEMTLSNGKKRILGNERILSLDLPLTPSTYTLYLRVKEKSTSYVRQFKTRLNVQSDIADGWLILNDIEGEARLDMLAYNAKSAEFVSYKDVLATISSIKLSGAPKMVYFLRNRDVFTNAFTDRIYVGTDKATYSINNEQRNWEDYRNLKVEVMRPTADDYHAVTIRSMAIPFSPMTYLIDSEGIVSLENVTQGLMHGPTLNRFTDGGKINISPFVAEKYNSINPYLLMFDINARRFLVHYGGNKGVILPISTVPDLFNPSDIKKDLFYMDFVNAATPQFYAIFKDPNGSDLSLLRFTSPVFRDTEIIPLSYEPIPSSIKLVNAKHITLDPNFGFIVYSVGSKVYQYDPFNKVEKEILDLGTREISFIKFQKLVSQKTIPRYVDFSKKLVLASYDPAQPQVSGTLDLYSINLTTAPQLDESFSGFGKIIDVTYRE
ncbi:PKD-like family lipoprotein [Sphingobacterium lumbrici]|uniref:PKD-like family lipoprotein n=1 Tax=Sphingobacterium lumbrici TaxID=2559600 RepID=UPI00112B48F4|nr:PKD-like family lipoprotein [Sphingobacterium lumbrici]